MARLIFHIGTHKAGSSSLQLSFRDCDNAQAYYPRIGGNHSHTIPSLSLFHTQPERKLADRLATGKADRVDACSIRRDFDAAVEYAGNRTLILSSEGVYRVFDVPDIERLRSQIESRFEDYLLVAYVRDPVSFISSIFQQRVKAGVMPGFYLPLKPIAKKLQRFDRVLGAGRLDVRPYCSDIVPDFASVIGIPAPETKRINNSLSMETISLLHRFNIQFADIDARVRRKALDAIGQIVEDPDAPRFSLDASVVAPLIDRNDQDWLLHRIGRDFPAVSLVGVRDEKDLLSRLTDQTIERFCDANFTSLPPDVRHMIKQFRSSLRPVRIGFRLSRWIMR